MCENLSIYVRVLCFQIFNKFFCRQFAACICTLGTGNQIEVFATEIETLEVFFVCLHHFMYCSKMPRWSNTYRSFVAFAADTFGSMLQFRIEPSDYYACASYTTTIEWVSSQMKEPPEEVARRMDIAASYGFFNCLDQEHGNPYKLLGFIR